MLKKILLLVGLMVVLLVVVGGLFVIRNALALTQIEQEWQTTRAAPVQNLGTTRTLEILPLFEEAKARDDLELEHGVSYLVKTDHANLLLDVGMTPARLSHNMQALGVTGQNFDAVLITHVHPDHIGGMNAWQTNTLVPGDPPLNLDSKRVYLPAALSSAQGNLIVATHPGKIAEGVATTGAIAFPELFPFSLKSPRNAEQVLAINVAGKGIVLIMGCGHPTVERIVARAQAAFDMPIIGIVGGLHYEGLTRAQVEPHIAFVSSLKPELVAVSPHDSSTEAIHAFQETFPGVFQPIAVGRTIRFGLTDNPLDAPGVPVSSGAPATGTE